jgi:hypothetical protein
MRRCEAQESHTVHLRCYDSARTELFELKTYRCLYKEGGADDLAKDLSFGEVLLKEFGVNFSCRASLVLKYMLSLSFPFSLLGITIT